MQIFIARDGEKNGPYSMEQAKDLLAKGVLQPEDYAFHEGLSGWKPISEVIATDSIPAGSPAPSAGPSLSATSKTVSKSNAPLIIGIVACLFILIGLAAAVGLYLLFENKRTEFVESGSNPPFYNSPATKTATAPWSTTDTHMSSLTEATKEAEPSIPEANPDILLWEFKTGSEVYSPPAIGADGTIYVGSRDNKVYALDGATGTKKWEFETKGDVDSSPAIGPDGTVYFGSDDNKTYALDSNGTLKWEFISGGAVWASPAIGAKGTVYIGSRDKKFYAVDGVTGTKKWEFETGAGIDCSPAIGSDGTVYFGSDDNKIYALDGETGTKKWHFETEDDVRSSPAIGANDTIYVGSKDKKVYALDPKTGAKKWEFETGNSTYGVYSSPAIGADGTVYVGADDHKLYALDGATGAKKWEFLAGSSSGYGVYSSPAIGSGGTVYIGSMDYRLYALDGATGTKKWAFKTGDWVGSSPAIGPDGTLYFGSRDNKVYALKTKSLGLAKSSWPMFRKNTEHTGQEPLPGLKLVEFPNPDFLADESQLDDPSLILQGKDLFQAKVCYICHQTDPAVPAPAGLALKASKYIGDFWSKETLVYKGFGGPLEKVVFGPGYFYESVKNSTLRVAKGALAPMPPPPPVTDEEIMALMAYVRSLSKK